jgi:hypothetical protein
MGEDSGFQFTDDAVPRAYDEVLVPRLFEPWAQVLLDDDLRERHPSGRQSPLSLAARLLPRGIACSDAGWAERPDRRTSRSPPDGRKGQRRHDVEYRHRARLRADAPWRR